MRRLWQAFRHPVIEEEQAARERVWEGLPEAVRGPDQALGRWSTGCGATWGVMERCDFACTACYLARGSNSTDPLSFDQVKEQIDALRAQLGPGGRTQITAGEVTLLPVDDLARIVRYARERELVPMVMTHGQRFLREPEYLERLVADGLDRFAFHVDTTQRGRDGGDPGSEEELHRVRDAMASLVRETRARTGRPLVAAHTVTVTRDNVGEVDGVVRWAIENSDAVRLLSFQPAAEVGRTRDTSNTGRGDAIWERIYKGLGRSIRQRTWSFGHDDCNQFAFFWVVRVGDARSIVEVRRQDSRLDDWFARRFIRSGLAGFSTNGEPAPVSAARLLGRIVRDPWVLFAVPFFCVARLLGEWRLAARSVAAFLRGKTVRVHAFCMVVHHFMDAAQIETPEGRERLDACAFKLPVDGKMVSMCEFNGSEMRASRLNTVVRA